MYSKRTYIAIDLKSFYASVECVERGLDPLTANLVVADASRTEKTICLAVTPALKAYGISGRARLFEVVQKVREIKCTTGKSIGYITAVPRMSLYIKYSANIYSIYLKYFSPEDIHVYSIDEVFIDVTNYLDFYHLTARELTMKVIKDVLRSTGITATAGIAPNLFLCKVAMDIVAKHSPADENGVRVAELDEFSFREKLWNHQPLTDFWRIGPGITARLGRLGLRTLGDVAYASRKNSGALFKMFGIDAEILIDHAWGYEPCTLKDIKGYHSKNNSLSSGQVLHEPYSADKARIVVREMAELMAFELFKKNFIAQSVTLWIGYETIRLGESGYAGEAVMDAYGRFVPEPAHGTFSFGAATGNFTRIVNGIMTVFEQVVDYDLQIRRINLCVNNVMDARYKQLDLFSDEKQESRDENILKTMAGIQAKYGKNALLKGTNLEEGATTVMRNSQIGGHRA